jgi:hypothetical protein
MSVIDADQLKALTDFFRRRAAKDPEAWARSQLAEGIPQVARFAFLQFAWSEVLGESADDWIQKEIASAESDPMAPFAGTGRALKRLKARGASTDEIRDLVRGAQAQLLFYVCRLLDGPGYHADKEIEELSWGLFQVDERGEPTQQIAGLHESVLATDPTGREGRPAPGGNESAG